MPVNQASLSADRPAPRAHLINSQPGSRTLSYRGEEEARCHDAADEANEQNILTQTSNGRLAVMYDHVLKSEGSGMHLS